MRVMEYHKTALSRQTAEAVWIQRRGGAGAVLNSKNKYNCCFIPSLWLIEEEVVEEMERAEEQELRDTMEQLGEQDNEWERRKRAESIVKAKRGSQIGSRVGTKNRRKEQGGRPSKVRKYALLDRE